jgi:hypothetical protein
VEHIPAPIRLLGGILIYCGLVRLFMMVILDLHPPQSVIVILGFLSLFGLAFTIFSLVTASARVGWKLFRMWVGFIGGLFIAVGPFAILPHPVMLVVGAVLGFGFAAFCVAGRFERLI